MNKISLLGQCFHTFSENGKLEWQGAVIGNPEPGWYLVQLCEWLFGNASSRRIVRIEEMSKWVFYKDSEQMNEAYDRKYSGEL